MRLTPGARHVRDQRPIRAAEDGVVLAEYAKRSGQTLSAHITEALARDVRRRRLRALIEEYEAGHGTIGEDELAEARRQWRG